MPATIVDGKAIAAAVLVNLKAQLDALGEPLHLVAVCAGEDPGLRSFVGLKQKAAEAIGIDFSSYFFDGTDTDGVIRTLTFLATDESVHGIFVELPFPHGWDTDGLLALIPPEKDVDALTAGTLVSAPAVLALQYVLHETGIQLRGLRAAVVGQGRLVGQPIGNWLAEQGAHVSVIDIDTPAPAAITREAQLLIAGVGKPGLVTGDWVSEDAIVIDFGYGKNKKGVYTGDVDMESVAKKAKLLTPVPGGMGPLVIAAVLENLVTLATRA